MIVKEFDASNPPRGQRLRAGFDAEKQMAFYLHRAFATDARVYVLNGVRLVDPEQADPGGTPGVAQIDHLVLHPHGAIIIESKSVSERLKVKDDGHGADEWSRMSDGRWVGMRSPIRQAGMQAEFLRTYLQRHREQLRERATGLQAAAMWVLRGSDQCGFANMPIQLFVAISDKGDLERVRGWKEPSRPFLTWAGKADNVAEMIHREVTRHGEATTFTNTAIRGKDDGDYGVWEMTAAELSRTADFLKASDQPRGQGRVRPEDSAPAGGEPARPATPAAQPRPQRANEPPPPPPVAAGARSAPQPTARATRSPGNPCGVACKGCGGESLAAQWGKFGYYWKCADCGVNTAMPTVCSVCGEQGARGEGVKIRKEGLKYFRKCEGCGIEECIWVEGLR
ncbi:MAG: NERD domain-containing protein [Phycisphaerales bacterium]|nr:NERD domain-containing protein [Phycisphaerales bacterium]